MWWETEYSHCYRLPPLPQHAHAELREPSGECLSSCSTVLIRPLTKTIYRRKFAGGFRGRVHDHYGWERGGSRQAGMVRKW